MIATHYDISIHALRGEGDVAQKLTERMEKEFLSTPSAGRATRLKATKGATTKYFYPRPPRGGRHIDREQLLKVFKISIHALRGEGDLDLSKRGLASGIFLSTPSAGRATLPSKGAAEDPADFYPRPPRGGRRQLEAFYLAAVTISIHALRGEGDRTKPTARTAPKKFLSTPSAGRATAPSDLPFLHTKISIHALRGEGDRQVTGNGNIRSQYFYPRPPRGGRPSTRPQRSSSTSPYFYPRPPRGGRQRLPEQTGCRAISIHALRGEGDLRRRQRTSRTI